MTDGRSDRPDVRPYTHLRPTTADIDDGVYRVVGSDGDAATLLRVADADGHRRHTGRIERVSVERIETGFAPTEDPDPAFWPRQLVDGVRWLPRALLDTIR